MQLRGKTICVYGGASDSAPQSHKIQSADVGRLIASSGAGFVFGGGRKGLMGASSLAAQETGCQVTGVITQFLVDIEAANHELDELIIVDTMHQRKAEMMARGHAFVILPGGFGTIEELMEVITLKQLGQLDKPIVFADFEDYWQPLIATFDHLEAQSYLHNRFEDLYTVAKNPTQVLAQIARQL